LPEVLGGGKGYEVRTEGEFDKALAAAWADRSGPSILQVHIDPSDCSQALSRLAERMAQTVVQKSEDEFSAQMAVAEDVMRENSWVLKKLAE
jgi:thiamine pyrophosphate-dependent acetolactate synthase large subunit-like protein